MTMRSILALLLTAAIFAGTPPAGARFMAFAQDGGGVPAPLTPDSLRPWLTYLASDQLEGRATFSEGLGLAAAYIAERLREVGVKPGGDDGTYFQRVSVLGVQSSNQSSVTVSVNGQTRTFAEGAGVSFSPNVGSKRTLQLDEVEFVGYGLNLGPGHNDYEGRSVAGKAVIWLGDRGPQGGDPELLANFVPSRDSIALEEMGAAASISALVPGFGRASGSGRGSQSDFTTTQSLDLPRSPMLAASDDMLEFMFSASGLNYADLRSRAQQGASLPTASLKGVTLTFNLDATYRVVNTRYTRNIIGMIDGTDPQLRDTFVAFGAHYDHLGYTQGILSAGQSDRISNGADDDGSGSTALIGLARAFAAMPTRRSLLFVWHAGEELGLFGSKYLADRPPVPMDRIAAQLNIDMIGRNSGNAAALETSVFAVGSDRISTELHNTLIDANARLSVPMTLDFDMNDPLDPERIYYRSDHFSYAAKGVPVIFFFTGLHPDYHQVTDSVEKIHFEKVSHIAQLVFETGRRVADMDHMVARDFKGPRVGKGGSGKLPE